MSEKNLKVGARVDLTGKDLHGTVAYVGMTSFAVGKWVGVVLDEPKGKNNGSIKGQAYFECPENCGMFVRPTQLRVIGAAPEKKPSSDDLTDGGGGGVTPQPTKATRLSGSRTSLSSSRQSLLGSSRSQLSTSLTERSGSSTPTTTTAGRKSLQAPSKLSAVAAAKEHAAGSMPTSEGGNGGGGSSHASSKRASFVETGFLEILKPQFTPSQPMRSPSFTAVSAAGAASASAAEEKLELQRLNEELTTQVADLTEKLETVRQRRNEDKERLRDFDKMKIQFEQLQEFRTKIMAAQASLQRELQRAKQEAKDAVEAREQHAQEMAELSDNVELITLDKEMAEEKSDTLQLELESSRERIEELQVDLELLRSEMQQKSETALGSITSGEGGGMSTYELKQLEQQNLRLKETLVRLRDLSAHDKHDIQKLAKELELKRSEVSELERTKEKLSSKIDDMEATVADLQEQVDAALGAEEMVEQLAEKKMELEDKVKLLEEEVAQLEALEEVHEQLVESNHELEMDLREELDLASAGRKEVLRERDAAIETIYDRDQTITKFRELVQRLNEQLLELRDRSAAAAAAASNNEQKSLQDPSAKLASDIIIIDYKQMFAESRAYTRAIDVQLRQIELTQAHEHVQMLSAFMPESFMSRGGDHDSILVILLISRIVFKCGVVVSQTRERFPAPEADAVTRESVIEGHVAQQYAFKCRLMHNIHLLQCALHQILYGLNSCQPDTLLRAGSSLPEMVAQEKTIDSIIELLKSNQLDENSTTEQIEKCVAFFTAMNSVLLAGEAPQLLNETQMMRDCVAALSAASESILNDAAIARCIISEEGGGGASDARLLIAYLTEQTDTIRQQVKLIKRRLPPHETHITKCGGVISAHLLEQMRAHTHALSRIMRAIHQATKQAVAAIAASIESDNAAEHTIGHARFWELLATACERVYEQDDRGPSQNFKALLARANTDLQTLAQQLLDKEYEIMAAAAAQQQNRQERPMHAAAPILLRAQHIKKQLEQKNILAATLENREADIKQLKLAAKMKQNELSEMQIRKDLAEKKLSVLQSEYEHTADKWRRQYEETRELLERKEREFEETMDHLQSDIEALEKEKSTLRDKLKASGVSVGASTTGVSGASTKRGSIAGAGDGVGALAAHKDAAGALSSAYGVHAAHATGGGATAPAIAEELQLLTSVFHQERQARLRLQAKQIRAQLKQFEPIRVPQPRDARIAQLDAQLTKAKHAWALSLLQTKVLAAAVTPDAESLESPIAMQRRLQPRPAKAQISARANHLAAEILAEYLQRNPHRASVHCDFGSFPTVEVKRVLKL